VRTHAIYGIDFTSAPGSRKPLACAQAEIKDRTMQIQTVQYWTDFADFEAFLGSEGPWVAAFDFPFGLPRKLVRNLRWPETWETYVTQVTCLTKAAFGHLLQDYQATRPNGDKHHLRQTDVLVRARSPMMWFGVPVARMFFEGVQRLLRSDVCILPCRPNRDLRVVLEGYPALVARRWIGAVPYKTEHRDNPLARARRLDLVQQLHSNEAERYYGLRVETSRPLTRTLINDHSADSLDAVLCALQAAWAFTQRENRYGIPMNCDAMEGWIIDPSLSDRANP
jgi:Protein of unknown function (DUF429)